MKNYRLHAFPLLLVATLAQPEGAAQGEELLQKMQSRCVVVSYVAFLPAATPKINTSGIMVAEGTVCASLAPLPIAALKMGIAKISVEGQLATIVFIEPQQYFVVLEGNFGKGVEKIKIEEAREGVPVIMVGNVRVRGESKNLRRSEWRGMVIGVEALLGLRPSSPFQFPNDIEATGAGIYNAETGALVGMYLGMQNPNEYANPYGLAVRGRKISEVLRNLEKLRIPVPTRQTIARR